MINLRIDWKGKKGLEQLIKRIEDNKIYFELQAEMLNIADKTVQNMRETIQENKKRPLTGNLEKTIDKEVLKDIGGIEIGIGNINKLKAEAPYFEVLDAGGYVPPANIGYFTSGSGQSGDKIAPEAGSSGQTWVHTGKEKGSFYMKPKKAIEGINYIEKGIRFCENLINITVNRLVKEYMDDLNKSI